LNGETTRQHSALSAALLGPENLTLDLNGKPANLIGNSFQVDLEYNPHTYRRAARRKNKSAMFAYVAASAFSLPRLAVPIRPPKGDCCLQQEPERLSRWPHKSQHSTPIHSRYVHISDARKNEQENESHLIIARNVLRHWPAIWV
jgi:hypothetical protein